MTDRLARAPRLWPMVAKRLDIVLQDLASFRMRTYKIQDKEKHSYLLVSERFKYREANARYEKKKFCFIPLDAILK